jgi:NAD(P)-dependent dehydrogenase (short-subunit alcohol dehydrogenase family)
MPVNLQNKTILITGASRGLGRMMAKMLWDAGANLILVARSLDPLNHLRDELCERSHHQAIEIFSVDLSHADALDEFIQKIHHKKIDCLINNAAISGPIGPTWENDWQDFQKTLQINLMSPIALCRALIPRMITQGQGKIINISGGGATNSRPNFSAYAIAKTGLVRFTEILADEVKPFNISVNCIAPGVMKTDMLLDIIKAGREKVGEKEYLNAESKLKLPDPMTENAGRLCLFLLSDESEEITGKLISATWDPWKSLHAYIDTLKNSDIYTLRRIIPEDRGQNWE